MPERHICARATDVEFWDGLKMATSFTGKFVTGHARVKVCEGQDLE